MNKLFLTLAGMLSVSLPSPLLAGILLNEVHLNPPNSDDNYEFIELKSTTNGVEACTGLSLVIINNDKVDGSVVPTVPRNIGEIFEVYSLNDLKTGTNGLLLLGNGYTANPRGGPWSGFVDAATAVADPVGMGNSDIGSNDGLTILLVSNFNGVKGQDVDVDDDNILDWTETAAQNPPANPQFSSQPWTTLFDSIGTRDRGTDNGSIIVNPYTSLTANITNVWINSTLGNRDPDTMARQLNNNGISSASAWYGGKLLGTTSTSVTYQTTRIFGPANMLGEVTPGRPNLNATLPATSFRINEVGLNPIGADSDRFQYIELINTSGAARSLNGYWLILLDSYDGSAGTDVSPGGGKIIEKWDLSSMATGTNGLLLIGNDFSSAYTPFNDLVSPLTGFGDPAQILDVNNIVIATSLAEGDIRFKNGFTMLLVQNFVAPANDDLDTNNDGTLDVPLTNLGTIVDQVGFDQLGKTTPKALGATYSTVNLRTIMPAEMEPDSLSRKAGDFSVAASAWYGGEYDNGGPSFNVAFARTKVVPPVGSPYDPWFGGFRGAGTPGLPNLSAPINPASPPVAASIRINEVMFNPTNTEATNTDDNNEYIELRSTNDAMAYLDGLWVIVVDLSSNIGAVVQSFPLDGSMTGLNGLVVIGDNYDNASSYPYRTVDGSLTPFCFALDPVVAIGGNDLPNDGLAIMILRGPKTGAGNPFTLSVDGLTLSGDLDPENDGTLLAPAVIATEVMDSISVAAVNPGVGYGWISTSPFKPHHLARYTSNLTPNNTAAWQYGQVSQQAALNPSLDYTSVWAGTFKTAGSPGRPNHTAPTGPSTVGSVVINEANVDPAGGDNNYEFVELIDAAGQRRSLNGYYLVMFDNVGSNTGGVRAFWSLDGMSTGDKGLLLVGNGYPLGGANNPWSTVMRPQTLTGDPAGREGLVTGLSDGAIGAETENLNANLLLVRSFNRYIGFDLDTKVGASTGAGTVDSPGDGILDGVAWTGGITSGIHDSIMFRDYIGTTPPPVTTPLYYPYDGFAYGLADLTTSYLAAPKPFYHPDSFARFYGELTPNSPASWYGGDLTGGTNGSTGDDTAYLSTDPTHPPFPTGFTGRVTPGQPNLTRNGTSDTDGDGITDFLELAFNSNLAAPDSPSPLPMVGTVNVAGSNYATLTYRRIKGGTTAANDVYSAEAYTYTVQTSLNLQTWTSDGSTSDPTGAAIPNADGVTETVTFRLLAPLTDPAGKAFMRLKVGRR